MMDIERKVTSPVKNPDREGQPKNKRFQIFLIAGLVLLSTVAVATSYYYYGKFSKIQKLDSQRTAQEETKALVERVGKLIVLPEGETPTIATISDPEKLKDQPFFAHAKKGDKVLIYSGAKKAILYDPVANKIVEVAPINLGETPGTTTNAPTPPPKRAR